MFVNDEDCVPVLGTKYSAGIDVKADIKLQRSSEQKPTKEPTEINIPPLNLKLISTGVVFHLPPDLKLYVFSKSGLAIHSGIYAKYGQEDPELKVWIYNGSKDKPFRFLVKRTRVIFF